MTGMLACPPAPPKAYRQGTHRTSPPEETLERLGPLLEPAGITRVANITGLDRLGLPVFLACRPESRSLAVSQGKGLTPAAARVSAIMESLETWQAERLALPLERATWRELNRRARVVPPESLNRYRQGRFHPDLPLLWVEGWDLVAGEPSWVPYELVHTNYTFPLPEGSGCFLRTSNGLASGNHLLEAVIHGLGEVVERDAATLWALSGPVARGARRLRLSSLPPGPARDLCRRIEAAGLRAGVWDITSDLEIPAFFARLAEPDPALSWLDCWGAGCHPHPEVALLRALTEAAQTRLTLISGARDDLGRGRYQADAPRRRDWLAEGDGGLDFSPGAGLDAATLEEDLTWLVGRLGQAGLTSVVVVDLGSPGPGLAVVRVIVPGLEAAFVDPRHCALGLRAQAALAVRR